MIQFKTPLEIGVYVGSYDDKSRKKISLTSIDYFMESSINFHDGPAIVAVHSCGREFFVAGYTYDKFKELILAKIKYDASGEFIKELYT